MENREFFIPMYNISYEMLWKYTLYEIGKRINTIYTYLMEQLEEVKLQCYKQPD